MRKSNLIVALLLVLILGVCLVACGEEETVTFTVTFDTQGGSDVAPITIGQGNAITLPENPTKEGYVFDGWYIDKDLLNEFVETQAIAGNITLYAKWKENDGGTKPAPQSYTITFDSQGGSEVSPITIEAGNAITLPNNPTKEGYIFDGWYVDKELLNKFVATQTIAENITLYAKWNCDHTPVTDVAKDADCENTGLTEGSHCSKCNEVLVEQQIVPALGHKYGTVSYVWSADNKTCTASRTCANDASHIQTETATISATVSQTATCTQVELSTITATFEVDWAETQTKINIQTGEMLSHTYSELKHSETEHWYECSCGAEKPDSRVLHSGGTATCYGKAECSVCHEKYGELAKHNYGEWVKEVPSTCTETGTKGHYECSWCHKYFNAEHNEIENLIISANHRYNNDGICENCGYFETELEFVLNDDCESWSVIGIGTFSGTDIKIPSANYDTKPVTAIVANAFESASITSVYIPSSVISIGDKSFYSCKMLTSVTFENGSGLKSIGSYAFANCENLNNIDFPQSLLTIGEYAYSGCTSLTEVTITANITSMGDSVFRDCKKLTCVNWNATACTSVGGSFSPFMNCFIETVNFGENVTIIPMAAFFYCSGIQTVVIPDSVTTIGVCAFYYCTSLKSAVLGRGVTNIEVEAFAGCKRLETITIPENVASIGGWAFVDCAKLFTINYTGTMEQWNEITFGSEWDVNVDAYIVYCSDGNIEHHGFGEWINEVPATCLKTGIKGHYECPVCHKYYDAEHNEIADLTIAINPSAHTYANISTGPVAYEEPHEGTIIFSMYQKNLGKLLVADGTSSADDYFNTVDNYSKAMEVEIVSVGDNSYKFVVDGDYVIVLSNFGGQVAFNVTNFSTDYWEWNDDYNTYTFEYKWETYCIGATGQSTVAAPIEIEKYQSDPSAYFLLQAAYIGPTQWANEVPSTCTTTGTKGHYTCQDCGKHLDASNNEIMDLTIASHKFDVNGVCEGCGYFETGLEFELNDDGASWSVKGIGTFEGAELIIPAANYDGNPVTSIGSSAFYGCTSLTSVTIGSGVTSFGTYAFYGCSELTRIDYNGTTVQWNAIVKSGSWNSNAGEYFVYCTDGSIAKDGTITYYTEE